MEIDRFAVFTGSFSRNSFEYTIKTLCESGLNMVELWGGISHCFPGYENEEQLREAGAILKEYGVQAAAFYPEQAAYPYNLAARELKVRERTETGLCVKYMPDLWNRATPVRRCCSLTAAGM